MCATTWPSDPPKKQKLAYRREYLNGFLSWRLALRDGRSGPHILGVMQHLELSDDEAAALIKELADITGNDRYPFSSRIQTLRAILAKLRPEHAREPSPPPK